MCEGGVSLGPGMYMRHELVGNKYVLRSFNIEDVTEVYMGWLNDPEVTRFLEIRLHTQTAQTAEAYIKSFYLGAEKYLWGIYTNNEGKLIGTASLYEINLFHRCAEIGLMIGDKAHWGTTASTEAIRLICRFAFEQLRLRRLTAGTYAVNTGINFTLRRLGFFREGVMRSGYYLSSEKFTDGFRWGLLQEEWTSGCE